MGSMMQVSYESAAPNEAVAFLAHREPRGSTRVEIRCADTGIGRAHGLIVEPHAALFDQSTGLALGTGHPEPDRNLDDRHRFTGLQNERGQTFRRIAGKGTCRSRGRLESLHVPV